MRGGGEGGVGVIGAGTSDWLREDFYNVEMQRERPGRQGLRDLQLDMTDGFAKRFTLVMTNLSMSPPGRSLY